MADEFEKTKARLRLKGIGLASALDWKEPLTKQTGNESREKDLIKLKSGLINLIYVFLRFAGKDCRYIYSLLSSLRLNRKLLNCRGCFT